MLTLPQVADLAGRLRSWLAKVDAATMEQAWADAVTLGHTIKISGGFYCGKVDIKHPSLAGGSIFLGKPYIAIELLSVLLVMCAAAACVLSGKSPSGGGNDSLGWSIFAACTTSFASIGFLLKETTFRRYAQVSLRTEDPHRPPGPHSAHHTLH